MFYKVEYQKRAHQEVEKIFRVLFPEQGLAVREEQIRLCHEMLDTLLGGDKSLCVMQEWGLERHMPIWWPVYYYGSIPC